MARRLLHMLVMNRVQEHFMWLIKIFLLLCFFNVHAIKPDKNEITKVGIEIPIPYPRPFDDDVMVA